MNANLIEAIAATIEAAGWNGLANDYRTRPEYRERIERAMVRNIREDRQLGPELADKLARLINAARRAA